MKEKIGDIGAQLKKLADKSLANKERIKILKGIVERKSIILVEKNLKSGTFIKSYGNLKKTKEYNANLEGGRSLMNMGYNVYMLPNPRDTGSADFILEKGDKLYYTEFKTLYGKSPKTFESRLSKGEVQSDRMVVNIVGNITSRDAGNTIKKFYLKNPQIKEIKVLLGGKPIEVRYKHIIRKNFTKTFIDKWAR